MAQILSLAAPLLNLFGGGQQQQQTGQLTPDEMAALQFSALNERNTLVNYYSNAGIPGSSGLAFDLGSIPFQTAAAAGGIEQSQAGFSTGAAQNTANQMAQLGTVLGQLNNQNTTQNTNPDTSNFGSNASPIPFTNATGNPSP